MHECTHLLGLVIHLHVVLAAREEQVHLLGRVLRLIVLLTPTRKARSANMTVQAAVQYWTRIERAGLFLPPQGSMTCRTFRMSV